MFKIRFRYLWLKAIDFFLNECKLFRMLIAWLLLFYGFFLYFFGKKLASFQVFSKVHSSGFSRRSNLILERWLIRLLRGKDDPLSDFSLLCKQFIASYCNQESMRFWKEDPRKIIGKRVLVVKSFQPGEKGVVILDYSYVFPIFMECYDVDKIIEKYHIVLQPSWTGLYNLEVLSYAKLKWPVFIEVSEPRDATLIDSLNTNLISVPTSSNWWIDHRTMIPNNAVQKDIDLIMVASWAKFKRHWSFFECLLKMRRRGVKLKVSLVGYPIDLTLNEVQNMAIQMGVNDQIEFFERLSPDEVNKQLNRAKVLILWSRREGVNRAIIEAMLADIPVILRAGFNYGYHYPYINEKTGAFADEKNFSEVVGRVLAGLDSYSPREWVMTHMTCQHATEILQNKIQEAGGDLKWVKPLVVKTKTLNAQNYWNEKDKHVFYDDYENIFSCMQSN